MSKNEIKIIGICGYRGQGKDTVGTLVSENLLLRPEARNSRVRINKFAEPMYAAVSGLTGIPVRSLLRDRLLKDGRLPSPFDHFTARDLLISIGEGAREVDPDIWVKKLAHTITIASESNPVVSVITDVRRPNEAQYVVDNGGILLLVEGRNTGEDIPDVSTERPALLQDYVDYVIDNSKDLDHLRLQIKPILDKFFEKS